MYSDESQNINGMDEYLPSNPLFGLDSKRKDY